MSCGNITTGYFRDTTTTIGDNITTGSPGRVILFSPESPIDIVYSPTFTVVPGSPAFIEAYNMPTDSPIYVNRLVRGSFRPPHATPCPPCNMGAFPGPDGIITARSRMTLGDGQNWWRLIKFGGADEKKSVLQLMIVIPGLYELELSSPNMIGNLQVEYITWNLSLTTPMPSVYYAGIAGIYGDI